MKKSIYKHLFVSIILFIGISQFAQAQVGKTFWFVAPEVTNKHRDDEAVLRITALDKDAYVIISLPADSSFTPLDTIVLKGKQVKVELKEHLSLIENGTIGNSPQPAINDWEGWKQGDPFKKGMLIESDVDITVYYEIANDRNPDRFTLKGDNALGTEFYIPSQNKYRNRPDLKNPVAREKVDIVATENDTRITFKLTDHVNGHHDITQRHNKGQEYTIILQRGESYCLRREGGDASGSLGGSHITSNKPIAITISDDSIEPGTTGNYDLVGDQLVPINVIGKEYVVVNTMHDISGSYENTQKEVYLVATKDGTEIKVNGTPLNTIPLKAGEMISHNIGDFDFIVSNHDIYVYP